jgi:site-specific recombinase XerD
MEQRHILRVFVASPGDVQPERDSIDDVVAELNRGIAKDRSLHLEIFRWETDAYPGFHPEGSQGLIDAISGIEDCNLLIGIFWKRFGTPVRDAKSGTEHEFRKAYEAWKSRGQPQIMFYFKQQEFYPKTRQELEQMGRVIDFKSAYPEEGLWWTFTDQAQFEKLVRQHIAGFIRTIHLTEPSPLDMHQRYNTGSSTAIKTPTYRPPSLDEQVSQWINSKKSKKTRGEYRNNMDNFRQTLQKSGLDLDSEDEERIASLAGDWAPGKKGGQIAPVTYNHRLHMMSSFYRFALKRKWVKSNPIDKAEKRQEYSTNPPKALPAETVKNGLRSIDRSTPLGKRDYALLCILLTADRHRSEVQELRCGDLVKEKNHITIKFKLIGTGEIKHVPLSVAVTNALNDYILSAYPKGYTADSPLWLSYSQANKGATISTAAIASVCEKYLHTSKVESTRRTYTALKEQVGIKRIEKSLGIT